MNNPISETIWWSSLLLWLNFTPYGEIVYNLIKGISWGYIKFMVAFKCTFSIYMYCTYGSLHDHEFQLFEMDGEGNSISKSICEYYYKIALWVTNPILYQFSFLLLLKLYYHLISNIVIPKCINFYISISMCVWQILWFSFIDLINSVSAFFSKNCGLVYLFSWNVIYDRKIE